MTDRIDRALDRIRRDLAATAIGGDAVNNAALSPGLFLRWDAETADVTVALSRPRGGLLRLRGRVAGAPRWLNLAFDLGPVPLAPGTAVGVVSRWRAAHPLALGLRLRSGSGSGRADTVLADPLADLQDGTARAALRRLGPGDPATRPGVAHSLVLSLPPGDFDLSLMAIAGLHHPAPGGPPRPGQTLEYLAWAGPLGYIR